jgi:hypothetical protein
MSKIAEKRTDEIIGEYHDGDYTDHSRHNTRWCSFKEGYDKAMEDFLEKAKKYIKNNLNNLTQFDFRQNFVEQFKNYMQDESEN